MSLCASFWFWFVVLGSFAVLLVCSFHWGWSLSSRKWRLIVERRIKACNDHWERQIQTIVTNYEQKVKGGN
jgi:hypothetical protein